MGDPQGPALQRWEIVDAFNRHDVEFLMVGGGAAQLHGATRPTYDLDLCVRWTPANLDRVGAALTDLDAGMRVEGMDEPFPVPHRDGKFIGGIELSTWRSPFGDVDILRNLPARGAYVDYDELVGRSVPVAVEGHQVRLASLEDIIVSKETVNRPPDRAALPELRALRDQQPAAAPAQPSADPEPPRRRLKP